MGGWVVMHGSILFFGYRSLPKWHGSLHVFGAQRAWITVKEYGSPPNGIDHCVSLGQVYGSTQKEGQRCMPAGPKAGH